MENSIHLVSTGVMNSCEVRPSSSKSESNRTLIINALSGNPGGIENLSDARDTQTMKRLLSSTENTLDVLDAGTTMRFLTAYLAITTRQKVVLTGSARMQERPIKILVEALNALGADISYMKNDGFPPMEIRPFPGQKSNTFKIPSNISSQYISALLMIAPVLPKGLIIELVGEIYSEPYIRMTLALMERFGVHHHWEGQTIKIAPQEYKGGEYTIESDWSGASYWYSFVSLAKQGTIKILSLREQSNQGDQAIASIMKNLGVESEYTTDGVILTKIDNQNSVEIDFRNCPDLAQTVMVSAAAQKINLTMTGLESLKIKETDRIVALQSELAKTNVSMTEDGATWHLNSEGFELKPNTQFETYDDHRMAMAFAPLCMIAPILVENPKVVEKSYPGFWDDLKRVGVAID